MGTLISIGLQLLVSLLKFAQDRQLVKAGEDAAIGRAALEMARRTTYAKALFDKVDTMDETGLDDLSDRLGRGV